jgi:hypothetical protein
VKGFVHHCIAKECPSTPMSGHEINSDEGSDDDESVEDDT